MNRMQLLIALTLIAIFGIVWGTWHFTHLPAKHSTPSPAATQRAQQTAPKQDVPPPPPPPAGPSAEELVRGIAHKGGSPERSLKQHLLADPDFVYKLTGKDEDKFRGDETDAKVVKRWAGKETHSAVTRAGYVDWKFGKEVRVLSPDTTSFTFQKDADGNLEVAEYSVAQPPATTAESTTTASTTTSTGATDTITADTLIGTLTFTLADHHTVAPTLAAAQFFGASPTTGVTLHVASYLYVYGG